MNLSYFKEKVVWTELKSKLKYFKQEHEMKMKILQVVLEMKMKEREVQQSQMSDT